MASKRIDIQIQGKDSTKGAFTSASSNMKKLQTEATSVASKIKSAFNGIGGALASLCSGIVLSDMIKSAGQAESKWNRIAAATNATATQTAELKNNLRGVSNQYGIAFSELSGLYETALRFTGTQEEALTWTKGIAATTKRTGVDQQTILSALQSGELGRNKALQRSVMTEAQRNKYLADGKMTQEEINQLMEENIGFVAEHNELTQDAESSWQRMDNATSRIKTTIGSALVPTVTKLAGIVEVLGGWFIKINDATGGIVGAITGIVLAAVALGAPLVWAASQLVAGAEAAWSMAAGLTESAAASKGITAGGATGGGAGKVGQAIGGVLAVSAVAGFVSYIQTQLPAQYQNTIRAPMEVASRDLGNAMGYNMSNGITVGFGPAIASIQSAWSQIVSGAYWAAGAVSSTFWGAVGSIRSAFWSIPGAVSGAMSSAYSIAVGWASSIGSAVSSAIGSARSMIGMGPAGARGPGIGLHYENYAGSKHNAWNASGTGMSGNCVDMTLGLMGAYGGSMVQGTWNGGSHVWWQSPSGQQLDPARKALEGTWAPPARGPGNGNFGNVVINGDVYGFDDFKRKVEQASASIGYDAGRF